MGLCRDLLSGFRIPATHLQRFAPVWNRMQRLAVRTCLPSSHGQLLALPVSVELEMIQLARTF
jgi:hypothetical protein